MMQTSILLWLRNHRKVVVLSTLFFTTYVWSQVPITGQVLDQETGQAIAGAIVSARWYATGSGSMGGGTSGCRHLETTKTDAEGRYRIPGWAGYLSPTNWMLYDRKLSLDAYKSWHIVGTKRRPTRETIYLRQFKGTLEEWFSPPGGQDLGLIQGGTLARWSYLYCGTSEEDNSYQLFDAIATDLTALAQTPDQEERARHARNRADRFLVDFSKPYRSERGRIFNVDPKDSYQREDLLK